MGSSGSPDRLNFHVGLAELKPALGGGRASFGDIIMSKKSLVLSLRGGAVSSSATRWVYANLWGPQTLAWPWWGLFPPPSQPVGRGMPGHRHTQGWWPAPAAWPGSHPGLPSSH